MLETLFIFGWNADYIKAFRGMLEQEDIGREVRVPVRTLFDPWPQLPVPRPKRGYNVGSETWTLSTEPLHVTVDLSPQVSSMTGTQVGSGSVGSREPVDFSDPLVVGLLDLDAIYADLVDYKARRGYGNLYVPRAELLPILETSNLFMLETDTARPELLQEGALRVLQTYVDRFIARKEREAEGQHLEPSLLPAVHESVPQYYTIRVSSESLLKEIEQLLRKPKVLFQDGGKPLPRLHVEEHQFSPLLLHPKDSGLDDVSVSPPGLSNGEARVLKDLREFWKRHHEAALYRKLEIHVLRNLPRVGVGFFRRSGFYPDFIVWLRDRSTKETRVPFVEPHGLHHGGLAGNQDKIEALKELEHLSNEPSFRRKKIVMGGYLLTETRLEQIPDAKDKTWGDLEREHRILRQDGNYMEKILSAKPQ